MTLNNKCYYSDVALIDVTLKMQCWGVVMLSNVVLSNVMLSVVMLSVVMLSVVMLSVVMLSAVTPLFTVVNNSFVQ